MRQYYIEILHKFIITHELDKILHCIEVLQYFIKPKNLINIAFAKLPFHTRSQHIVFVAAAKQYGIDLQESQLQRPTCHNLLLLQLFICYNLLKCNIFSREPIVRTNLVQQVNFNSAVIQPIEDIVDTTLC